MPATIHLANGTTIDREAALDSEDDIVSSHAQFQSVLKLYMDLWEHRSALVALVAKHIGVDPKCIKLTHFGEWKRGTFNVVLPMLVKRTEADAFLDKDHVWDRVLLRVPMPAKVGEEYHPGSVADKLRCETASYIWMQRHCSDVRIPYLYGFGFPGADGAHFSHASRQSVVRRIVLYVRQLVASWLRRPVPSVYLSVAMATTQPLAQTPLAQTGYMVLEHLVEDRFGKQLAYTVPHDRPLHDLYAQEPVKTRNLCRGIARIMLALARVPQPRIGAFRFCQADGTIRLDGRPVSCSMAILESRGVPRTVGLDTTYTSVTRYVSDLASFQDSAFRAGPNAALSRDDAEYQMAVMAMLRAVTHHFVDDGDGDRDGADAGGDGCGGQPYVLHLSDGTPGNILVDGDWQVTGIFDLEWLFAAPVARLGAPSWLTWQATDEIAGEHYDSYCASRNVFMDALREEEGKQTSAGKTPFSDAIDASWASQCLWFYVALSSVNAMTKVFQDRLRPLFWRTKTKAKAAKDATTDAAAGTKTDADATTDTDTDPPESTKLPYDVLCQMWQPDAQAVVAQKLRDREQYKAALELLFEDKVKE